MRRAFTLIEQLAALALAALFMVAALAVLAGVTRDRKPRPDARPAVAFERAADLIARDLLNARRMRAGGDGVTLAGFCSLDPATLAPDFRPVRVTYRVERDGPLPRLVRRQEALDVLGNRNAWSELVCDDVAGVELTAPAVEAPPATAPASRPAAELFGPADGRDIPATVRLVLTPAGTGVPTFDRMLCIK